MFQTKHNFLVGSYFLATLVIVGTNRNKHDFLWLGLLGQLLLAHLAVDIYLSKQIWASFHTYALMYVLYVLSFSCIDVYFHLHDKDNFGGKIHKEHEQMFLDFVYVNISTISTIGYGDIVPLTTATRSYFCYKIVIAIFMIVFLVSDIVVKSKN